MKHRRTNIRSTLRPALLALSCAVLLSGCGGDGGGAAPDGGTPTPSPSPTPGQTPAADCPANFVNGGVIAGRRNCVLPNLILADLTLPNRTGTVYSLPGRVDVGRDIGGDGRLPGGAPATLTIEPGVVVFGSGGLNYLVVNRGSKLEATGRADAPIVFTSRSNLEGLADDNSQGQWGGVILLGRAPISDCLGNVPGGSANCEQTYEGLTNTLYGGAQADDSSGTIRYVQIRYAGFELFPNQEINGLTLAGVGAGTTIDHVQVHNSADDGIELFGGRANARHLVLTGNDDDGLDTDQGYQGFIQYVIAAQRTGGASGDDMLEVDSSDNVDSLPRQWLRLANFTFIQRSNRAASALLLRGGADVSAANGVVVSNRACLDVDQAATVRAADAALQDQGAPMFRSVVMTCTGGAYVNDGDVPADTIRAFFEATGLNNDPAFRSSLTAGFVNGANESAIIAYDATRLGGFFQAPGYIGAVRDVDDRWYAGWTCNSATLSFGGTRKCTDIP